MTVAQFQRVNEITQTTPDTVEQLAWIICEVFGKDPNDVAKWSALKFLRYTAKLNRRTNANPRRLFGVKLQTDAAKITFGQFIEVQHWLKLAPDNVVAVMDLVAASIRPTPVDDHAAEVERIRGKHFAGIAQQVASFVESQNALLQSFSGLFGIDKAEEPTPEDEPLTPKEPEHPFVERYGWFYSAEEIRDLKGIPLDGVYRLPTLEAFNYLAYLKSRGEYNKYLAKK